MDEKSLHSGLAFLRETERLKDTLRSAVTRSGRAESTAEHTWRLCLMVMVFADQLGDIDLLKLMKMCVIHDLGETYAGDVPAIHQTEGDRRKQIEQRDMKRLTDILNNDIGAEIIALWYEYETAASPEAKLAKGFDKLETILQHTQGANAPDFDYAFNLDYGAQYTQSHPLLKALRSIIDDETAKLNNAKSKP